MARKKNTDTTNTPSDYERFLRGLKLLGLGLETCSATLNRGEYFAASEKGRSVRQIEAKYDLVDMGENYLEPTARFKLTVSTKQKDHAPALLIECSFSTHFHAEGVMSREFAKRFTDSEFRVVMWPYFRQFVSDLTARMTIPPVIVPFASPAELRR